VILLVFATVLSSTAAVIGQAIMSLDKMWWAYTLNVVWAIVLLPAAILLVPRYGALGLAEAFLAAYAANALTAGIYAQIFVLRTQLKVGK
jgi:O-antigen/teichoic acid export membrane protein